MKTVWILLAVLLIFSSTALSQEDKPKIAANTFENPSNYGQSTIGNALTDIFVTELSKGGRFRIIDPTIARDQVQGADYLISAKVTNFSYQEKEMQAAGTDVPRGQTGAERVYEQLIDVRIDFRIVNAATHEVILADTGEAHEKNVSAQARMADYNRLVSGQISVSTQEVLGSMMGHVWQQ